MRLGWSLGPGDAGATIDSVRGGFGLAIGSALAKEHVWIGGAAALESVTVFTETAGSTQTQWLGMVSLSAIVSFRFWQRFLAGVEFGPDFYPLQLIAKSTALEWDVVRFTAGLRLGVILGPSVH